MDLGILSLNKNSYNNNTSFGMAKFSDRGYKLALAHADIYEALGAPNRFQNPAFFIKKPLFKKAPFTEYYIANAGSIDSVHEISDTIIKCGATDNTHTNANFIKQLLDTESYIHASDDQTKSIIGNAANEVLKKNWDNPELSKKDTLRLLEIAKYGIDDRAYISLNGAIQLSDAK